MKNWWLALYFALAVMVVVVIGWMLFGGGDVLLAPAVTQIVKASDRAAGDFLGYSFDAENGLMLVGADGVNNFDGAAYAFQYDSVSQVWQQKQKITLTGGSESGFGFSVKVDGNRAVVSALRENNNVGAVYFYEHNGASWVFRQRIAPSDGQSGDLFGGDFALSGKFLAVTSNAISGGSAKGTVYIYEHNGVSWAFREKLVPPSETVRNADKFGNSIDMDGEEYLVVSSYDSRVDRVRKGAAWIYYYDAETDEWSHAYYRLSDSAGKNGDIFGYSVSVYDDRVIAVGAMHADTSAGVDAGKVYVYRVDDDYNFLYEATLQAPDGVSGDYFGASVDVKGDVIVVGALNAAGSSADSGAVYVYRRGGSSSWAYIDKFYDTTSTVAPVGFSVETEGNSLFFGHPFYDNEKGAVFVYDDFLGVGTSQCTINSDCDDTLFCTVDTCDVAGVCAHVSKSANDGISCTVDSCDETNDELLHVLNDALCPAGKVCVEDGGCFSVLPNSTNFNGSTTNFSKVSDLTNVVNATLEVLGFGMINFSGAIDFSGLNLNEYVNILDKKIEINVSGPGMLRLNVSSRLFFYNVDFVEPKLNKDGVDCVACSFVSYSNDIYVSDVLGFSVYQVVEGYQDPGINNGQNNNNGGSNVNDYGNDDDTGTCPSLWSCGSWGECLNGNQTRICTDLNGCRNATFEIGECELDLDFVCEVDEDCGEGRVCADGVCEDSSGRAATYLIVAVILIVVAVVIAVFVIWIVVRGKKSRVVKNENSHLFYNKFQ